MCSRASSRDYLGHPKRFNSVVALNESWKNFYEIEDDAVGRGGAGKVFRIRPKSAGSFHERKSSVPVNLSEGEFSPVLELINVIPEDKSLAVKIIRRFRGGRDSIEKIRNEIELIKALQPSKNCEDIPSAVAPLLFSVHEDPTQVAIVMEFAKGGSLFDLCVQNPFQQSLLPSGDNEACRIPRVPESYISSVILKVTSALTYLHEKKNIVHLDIKAENILLREPYPSSDVFITDFGLAAVLDPAKPFRMLAGTPDYTAPEVISYEPVSFATDMWCVGVLTYFLLTGVSPFLGENKSMTMSNISKMCIEYHEDLFSHRSAAALAFIKALILRNPRSRLTARQCTEHEWLQSAKEQSETAEEQMRTEAAVKENSASVADVTLVNNQDPSGVTEVEETAKDLQDSMEDPSTNQSGDESGSDTSTASSASSPARKRPALEASPSCSEDDELECDENGTVEPRKEEPPAMEVCKAEQEAEETLGPLSAGGGVYTRLVGGAAGLFPLEGLPRHLSVGSVSPVLRNRQQTTTTRRRSVLATISPPPTPGKEISQVD